ncbi:MAG: HAMP domain-containing sensor histidine kinase, partial [Acidimicrobiia bacterium]
GVRTVGMVTSALSVSEDRYGSVFGAAPVGLIEADFSAVGAWLAELPVDGAIGLREYLSDHPDQVAEAMSLLDIREVNRTALDLMGADSRQSLVRQLVKNSNSPNTIDVLTEQLVAIWEQRADFEMSYTAERTDGVRFSAMLGTTFPKNADGDLVLSRGIISLTDTSGMVDSLRLRDDLIASVSHELRTPLTSLAGFSHELSERPDDFDDAEKAQTMDIIVREADALTYIIDNLLVASRGDTSALKLHMEPVEMATYLASISLDLGVIQAGKRLRFGPCEAVLYADQLRLRQILRNLVDNAVTYGGDEITIDAVTLGDIGMVTISDNGAGLPQGKEGPVFERYRQVARAKGQPMSLGLGLPVALSLARAMGGDLTYSRRNGLTIFELKLDLPPTSALSDVA